jgi:capsular polysaccharide transport system permease protein
MRDPAIVVQARVIGALILRDVKTRFGGKAANYLIAIAWPLSHIAVLMLIYAGLGRPAPLGTSPALFFATGLLPFMVFWYASRQIPIAVIANAPLLAFPVVTTMDIILARAILEFITGLAVVVVLGSVLYGLEVPIMPRDPVEASAALAASLFLAFSVGIVNAVIQRFVKIWYIVYIGIALLLYLSSGIIFVVDTIPERLRSYLVWNPGLHLVTWFRSSYYEGYGQLTLDKTYVLMWSIIALAVGLVLERGTRRLNPA